MEAFGRVDVLFNNAGLVIESRSILDTTEDDWTQVSIHLSDIFIKSFILFLLRFDSFNFCKRVASLMLCILVLIL
jgi:NAD(P)-dependent dehydrogenase (short-subunit alcohol dehydrogenase family)